MAYIADAVWVLMVPRKDWMPVPSGKQCSRWGNWEQNPVRLDQPSRGRKDERKHCTPELTQSPSKFQPHVLNVPPPWQAPGLQQQGLTKAEAEPFQGALVALILSHIS